MTTSEQIIQVLDELGQRFGIVINWTSENVLPYLETLMGKLITYKITTNSIGLIFSLITFLICLIFIVKAAKGVYRCNITEVDNIWGKMTKFHSFKNHAEPTVLSELIFIIGDILGTVTIILTFVFIFSLIKWIMLPELAIFDLLSSYIGAM